MLAETKYRIIGVIIAILVIIGCAIGYVALTTTAYKSYEFVTINGIEYSTEDIKYVGRSRSGGYDIILTDGTDIFSENVVWHK